MRAQSQEASARRTVPTQMCFVPASLLPIATCTNKWRVQWPGLIGTRHNYDALC